MSDVRLLEDIIEARARIEKAQQAETQAVTERDRLIREAVAGGVPVAQIVEASGVSRARVYQIRDGRR